MKALLPLLALTTLPLAAQSVSSDDAREVARQFFAARATTTGHHAPAKTDPVLAYTAVTPSTISGQAPTVDFYVFNRAAPSTSSGQVPAAGFVIVNAADGAEVPILGYSETSTFDYDTAPANLRWWLEQYQKNGVARVPAKAGAARHDVDPLVPTKWGQDAPYNSVIQNTTGYGFVTGCTATAMAQIMKRYEWPKVGKGSKSYDAQCTYDNTPFTLPLSVDFSRATYDWANMLDDYSKGYNPDQSAAVGLLMYHAGVAEDISYGDRLSSADDRHSGIALIEHFNYDPSMLHAERHFYSDIEWDEILYSELAEGRPVLYAGSTIYNEGHEFVCDGYDAASEKFHFNWGWNGTSDGYFAIVGAKALLPSEQGTGGAPSGQGFVCSQSISYNIRRAEGGTPALQFANFADNDSYIPYKINKNSTELVYETSVDCAEGDENVTLYCVPYNYGLNTGTALLAAKLINTATHEEIVVKGSSITLAPGSYSAYYSTVTFNTKEITADGTYEVIPMYRDNYDASAPWQTMRAFVDQQKVTLTVTGTASRPTYVPQALTVTEVVHQGDPNVFTCPDDFKITVKVENNTGASLSAGWVCPRITHDGGWYSKGSGWNGTLPAGFTSELNFNLYNSDVSFTPGHVYTVEFYKDISNSPDNELLPGISSFSFIYASPEPTIGEMSGAIREARGGHATIPMIERMAEKVLKK